MLCGKHNSNVMFLERRKEYRNLDKFTLRVERTERGMGKKRKLKIDYVFLVIGNGT